MTATFHVYASCRSDAGGPQQGTSALQWWLLETYTYATNMGIYNYRVISGTSTLSQHSCGRAGDTGVPTLSNGRANTSLGNPIVELLIAHAWELGLMGIIYNRIRYDRGDPRGAYYGGVHPHYNHLHWEQTAAYAAALTRADIVAILGQPSGSGGFDMLAPCKKGDKGQHVSALQVMLHGAGFGQLVGKVDGVYGNMTSDGLLACRKSVGSGATSGDVFDHWAYEQVHHAHAKRRASGGEVDLGDYFTKTQSDARYVNLGENIEIVRAT